MIKSMTSFGRGKYSENGKEYTVEIKSINHRYYDINMRIPRQYSFLEEVASKIVSKYISRGKIDITVIINDFEVKNKQVLFNEELIKTYVEEAKKLENIFGIKNDLSFSNIIMCQDIAKVLEEDEQGETTQCFEHALKIALESVKNMRETEGAALKEDILAKIGRLKDLLKGIEDKSGNVVNEYREKLKMRIAELIGNGDIACDETRLNMEVAIFADRSSIDEEVTRFKSHILQLKNTLELNEPVGKKLDFIVQELNREANTMGSKANDLTITQSVIEAKNIIEMIREQIQNIE